DLGLGRAPGTDQRTAFALRRNLNESVEDFPMQVNELQDLFSDEPKSPVRAILDKAPMFHYGSLVQVDSVHSLQHIKDCLFPLPVILHLITYLRRLNYIVRSLSLLMLWKNHMPCLQSI